jgi:flagellar motor switch protein FliG
LKGIRKAAMLLMSLEPGAAAELIKAAQPEVITQIAAELACLEAADEVGDEAVREFHNLLQNRPVESSSAQFVRQLVEGAVGPQRSEKMLDEVDHLVQLRDPFRQVRTARPEELATALHGESGQVTAMVLAELPPSKSTLLVGLLSEEARTAAIRGMASSEEVSPEAKLRVARAVEARLHPEEDETGQRAAPVPEAAKQGGRQVQLRKVAVLLRGLESETRAGLTESITAQDEEVAQEIQRLMIIWEDLPDVSERSLQEALRTVDSQRLALALSEADETTIQLIRSNISERASSMLDEEASLMSETKDEDRQNAREGILDALRDLNKAGELTFENG